MLLETTEGTIGWRMHEARKRLIAAMAETPVARNGLPSGRRIVNQLELLLGAAALSPDPAR